MLSLPRNVRVYLCMEPCDMRRQMDGLATVVREGLGRDPRSGDLYVFRNRRGDMLKILFFDQQGYCLLGKRMDKGTFRIVLWDAACAGQVELTAAELASLLGSAQLLREQASAA